MTAIKSLLFLILVPGLLVGYIPLACLLTGAQIRTGAFSYLAFLLWLPGGVILVWSFWDFLARGRGTPAPIDPPRELVISGFYRYVRNPMYVGVFFMLMGHFLWFGYWGLLAYAGFFCIPVHLFVVLYEEPNLKKRFGMDYEKYLQKVPRWFPRLPGE